MIGGLRGNGGGAVILPHSFQQPVNQRIYALFGCTKSDAPQQVNEFSFCKVAGVDV